jgi:hypothetical protein
MPSRILATLCVALAIVSVALVLYINGTFFYMIATKQMASDMASHIIDAKLVVENKVEVIYKVSIGSKVNISSKKEPGRYRPQPHPVFHYALITVKRLLNLYSYEMAWWYTMMASQIITLALTTYLVQLGITKIRLRWCISTIFGSMLLISSSIYIPWYSPNMYVGYLNGNIYHNSTSIIAKPIAYLTMITMTTWLNKPVHVPHTRFVILTSIMVVISALAKPNIPLAIIPAWTLLIGFWWSTDQSRGWRHYVIYLIPVFMVALVMFWQAQIRFDASNTYGISWWYVAQSTTPNPLISLCLTVAFPISMMVFYPHIRQEKLFQLTFVSFVVAVFTYWLMYETRNPFHNNFSWGARIMGSALFALACAHLLNAYHHITTKGDIVRFSLATSIFTAHILSGILYTIQVYQSKYPFI